MNSPYSPPDADLKPDVESRGRVLHAVVAFLSGLIVIPAALFVAAAMFFPYERGIGDMFFWASILAGSVGAGVLSFPFKRMPLWLAVIAGPICVLVAVWWLSEWANLVGWV
jgi:hypothetical protein